ncbi:GerAB/ArcD/ProY family transporter [Neobacillus cucumis]|uniref:GerAB/ArcD/ProY family transporter n=1 Tax=Neobacillus cucumis TaxID=1740721 RepID=UPI0019652F78|nr:GerAB/ArcD/ProY family transporter [Neobacillus cucumis]MBM7655580.1 spore germination protein KB [Neobacillus cucumis]
MEKAKISAIQLFVMMFMFELGSALVVSYGITAHKDAWLAILLGMSGGVVLFLIYYTLFRQYPNLPLTGYARKIFGKYVGWIIGLLYVVFLLYDAARDLRDFGELLLSSTLTETPLLAINILLVLAICYVLYLGIEVLARTAEVFFVILLFIGFTGNMFVFFSGNIDFKNLQPFLENGWKPILTTAFPLLTFFPFGEMIAFTMLLPYLNRHESAKKVGLFAVISSGLSLAYNTSLNIAVLSVGVVERSTFPLLSTIGKVNLMEFLQRLDALVVFTLLILMFFKIAILFYGAVIGIVDLCNLKNHQQIVLPAGIILIFLSMAIASNFAEHIEEGQKTAQYFFFPPIMVIIPFLMLLVSMIRSRNGLKHKAN